MKTNKHQTLLFIQDKGSALSRDIVSQFAYSSATARSYLSRLGRQGLLEKQGPAYILSQKGEGRLKHFEVMGCDGTGCPLCQMKAGGFTCPRCSYKLPQKKSRIRPEVDFLLLKRPAGVHCPICQSQILTVEQARLVKVREDKK